jgi:hypothetical protein
MLDFYGLGQGFPGMPPPAQLIENINDDPNSAPSRRVLLLACSYREVIDATLAAQAIGIAKNAR